MDISTYYSLIRYPVNFQFMQTVYRYQGIKCFILFFLLISSQAAFSQGVQKPIPKEVTYGPGNVVQQVRYGYQEYLPVGYNTEPGKKWPLIITMVGIGECGDGSIQDLDTIAGIGIPKLIDRGRDYPFLIMSPQPTGNRFLDQNDTNKKEYVPDTLANFVEYIVNNYNVDPDRIYVTAFSAAVQVAAKYIIKYPGRVTAFVPISGNMEDYNLTGFCTLGNTPIWAFHNNIDEYIKPKGSINFYNKLNDCEPPPAFPPKLTVYKVSKNTHDAWTKTYSNRALDPTGSNVESAYDPFDVPIYDWFLQHSKNNMLIADAGGDQTLFLPKNTAVLEGSSVPTSGVAFQWAQIGSVPAVATVSGQTTSTFTASNLVNGNYQFVLTVTDASNRTDKDTVNVFVRSFSADAGDDTTVTVANSPIAVSLTGQAAGATEQEKQTFTYEWAQVTGTETDDSTISNNPVTISNANAATASVPLSLPGDYRFTFTIIDPVGAISRDTVDIIARFTNDSLVANAGPDIVLSFPVEAPVVLVGEATDAYNKIISYQWTKVIGPAVTLTDTTTTSLKLTNPQSGQYVFALTVRNDNEGTASDTVRVSVGNFTANAGNDTTVTLPVDTLKLAGSASDPVNNITAYAWTKLAGPDIVLSNPDTPTLVLTTLRKGAYSFELVVTNDIDEQARDTVQLQVNSTNDSLVANAGKDITKALPVKQVVIKGAASDPYNQITGYTWKQIAGEQVALSELNADSLVVSNPQEGKYIFEFTVINDNGGVAIDTTILALTPVADVDAELVAIVSPVQAEFPYFASHPVSIQIKNNGNVDINGFTAEFSLNGQTVTEQTGTIIAVGETITYTFAAPADLTAYGNYSLQANITLADDKDPSNNAASAMLQWLDVIKEPGYSQDFEGGDGSWKSVSNQTGWQVGTSGNAIPSAEPGDQAWFTNLEGNYTSNDTSYLISPIFDFSTATSDPVISYDLWKDIDPSDTLYVSVSLDGGATWTTLEKMNGSNQTWINTSHMLEGAAGNSNVIVRFAFISNEAGSAKGAGIDNVNICQSAPAIAAITKKETLLQSPLEVPLTITDADPAKVEIIAFSDNQDIISDDMIKVINQDGAAKLQITANTLGDANITVVVQQTCSGSTTFAVAVVDKITGLEDELEDVAVVFPNPSNGIFSLNWKNNALQRATVNIYNAQGSLVKSLQPGIVRNQIIDLSTQAAGTYMLVIRAEGKTRTYRLIKN